MSFVRTLVSNVAVALLAAGCATAADTAALATSIESLGQWSASAPPARSSATAAQTDTAQLPVVSQAARR
jgi:hypothetical protein